MKNPEAVKKWVAALRSGEFKQTTDVLHNKKTGGYCCLGVACAIAKREGVIPKQTRWTYADYYGDNSPAIELAGQYEPVRKWLGLSDSNGRFGEGDYLVHENDTANKTFSEIADIIESNPPGLFEE